MQIFGTHVCVYLAFQFNRRKVKHSTKSPRIKKKDILKMNVIHPTNHYNLCLIRMQVNVEKLNETKIGVLQNSEQLNSNVKSATCRVRILIKSMKPEW